MLASITIQLVCLKMQVTAYIHIQAAVETIGLRTRLLCLNTDSLHYLVYLFFLVQPPNLHREEKTVTISQSYGED